MFKFDVTKDSEATKVVNWCKVNGFDYNIEIKDKERSKILYPFNIEAPIEKLDELKSSIGVIQ